MCNVIYLKIYYIKKIYYIYTYFVYACIPIFEIFFTLPKIESFYIFLNFTFGYL